MTERIEVPATLTPTSLFPFSIQLRDFPVCDHYLFDFQNLGHVEPFGMLFLAALIRQFVRARRSLQGKECKIQVINFKRNSYASFMGLFKSFGLDYGKDPGEASGSGTYIPLTRLPISKLTRDAREEFRHQAQIIEREAQKATRVLTRNDSGPITETLSYAICEIMRNIAEHGQTSHIWYAAQYWPSKNLVEVAVLDEGVGLGRSLRRNSKLVFNSNEEAIYLALQPGVSGVANPNRILDGDWANTGYGLYMTSSLCKSAGDFLICNYSHAVSLHDKYSVTYECAYEGLAIRMVLNTTKIREINSALTEFRKNENTMRAQKNA